MHETLILDKPVLYGSDAANLVFIALVSVHACAGAIACVSSIVAIRARKGARLHLRWGRVFVRSMVATALTGMLLDTVRLLFFFNANHTKYVGSGEPSSIPARIAFFYAAFCILYLGYLGTHRRVFLRRESTVGAWERFLPWMLFALGLLCVVLILVWLNPWTGALWMIATFWIVSVAVGRMTPSVAQHRMAMLFLAAFSWWGAFQGFVPGLVRLFRGDNMSAEPYVGHLPGVFSPSFVAFLMVWAPAFLGAFLLHRRALRRGGW